jgi:hypothetical protein
MATSSFTKEFTINSKAAEILADDLSSDKEIKIPLKKNFIFNDKEFIEKCLGLSDYED